MENKSGIYQWRNLLTNKVYIGSAKDLYTREKVHLARLRKNNHHSIHFQRSYNQHGEGNFVFEILEYVENKEKLIEREQHYLDKLGATLFLEKKSNTFVEKTYNMVPRAGSSLGHKMTEEQNQRNRERAKVIKRVKCLYCDKITTPSKIARWHNDRCLNKPGIDVEKEKERRKTSVEVKEKQSKKIKLIRAREETKQHYKNAILNRPLITCPHCNYESYNKGNMTKCHFDRCKENPNFDYEAEAIRKREWSIKLKEAAKNKELVKCPHCGYENRNKGNMIQNHFDNCKSKKMI